MAAACARRGQSAAQSAGRPIARSSPGTIPALRPSGFTSVCAVFGSGAAPKHPTSPDADAPCAVQVQPEPSTPAPKRPSLPVVLSHSRGPRDYNRPGMPLPQQPVRRRSRLTTAVAVSVVAHVLLLLGVAKDAMFHPPKRPVQQVVSLVTSNRSQLQGIRSN